MPYQIAGEKFGYQKETGMQFQAAASPQIARFVPNAAQGRKLTGSRIPENFSYECVAGLRGGESCSIPRNVESLQPTVPIKQIAPSIPAIE